MKRTTVQPGGVAVMEEPEDWAAALDREQREAQDAKLAERNEAQRASDERLQRIASAIGEWFPAAQREARRVAEGPIGLTLGPSPRGGGNSPQIVIGVGSFELIGARGRAAVRLLDDGCLLVERRCFGSGYDTDIRLELDAAGHILPDPATAVREILEPLIRQLGQLGRKV